MAEEQSNELFLEIKEQFDNDRSFKQNIELLKGIERSVKFENGKQWSMDEDIADYPKITLNIIKQIGKVRKSNIMQNEYSYLVNSTNFKSVRKIQDFLKYLADINDIRTKDLKALNDDYLKGTAIGYFYWDAQKHGFMRRSGGQMRYEMVDVRKFAVANPYLQNIQDQEWVIFVTQEKVGALKARYGKEKNIVPSANNYTSGTEKVPVARNVDDELVDVYTKFYRDEQGEVFFVVVTETCILKNPTPINPFYEKPEKKDPTEQESSTSIFDEKATKDSEPKDRSKQMWNLFPFCRLVLNELDNCFYGMPVTIEYIEAQKSINNHFSVYDKALQDNVLGGWMYRKGAVDPNELTAENGNMIGIDSMPNEQLSAILARLPVANPPEGSHEYSQALLGISRQIAGASNVQLGQSDYSGQSGKQTQMLLERAKENASDNAMMFNQFKKDQAEIMFLFAKFFYDNEAFTMTEHGFEEDNVRSYMGDDKFDGTDYLEDEVMITIKVGSAPSFSEYNNMEMMGMMVQSGQLPPEAYITLLPDGYISNKQELLKIAKNNSLVQIKKLEEEKKQMVEIMKQMAEAYKQTQDDRKNIDVVIRENENLKSMIAEVSAKAIQRLQEATKKDTEQTSDMQNILNIINSKKTA
jgi:hypothetical protein